MNIELVLIVLLVGIFAILFYANSKKSDKEISDATYNTKEIDNSEQTKQEILSKNFNGQDLQLAKRVVDSFGFSFAKNSLEFLPNPSSENIHKLTISVFDTADIKIAREIIDQYGPNKPHQTRVQLAIIFLSGGKIDNIKTLVQQAKSDWKSVCHQAEQPFSETGFKNYVTWLINHSTEITAASA